MDKLKLINCLDKLNKIESNEDKIKVIYMWVKQGYMSFSLFKELILIKQLN